MAAILVDYENVGNSNGLRGVDVLQETDTLFFFTVAAVARYAMIICRK